MLLQINPKDNVAVALEHGDIPRGHKAALRDIPKGAAIIKYGFLIGTASEDIAAGQWVHTHNIRTALSEQAEYVYAPEPPVPCAFEVERPVTFSGYLRPDGQAGIRNEIWIVPAVGCVNDVCETLARAGRKDYENIFSFTHPYGCSQTGDDHAATRKLLAALCRHPNAGGVLVVGLGCENNTMESFKHELGDFDSNRVKFMVCQEEDDEIATGLDLLRKLADYAGTFAREPLPVSKLIVGMKCGGSDGLSGITANPAVGAFCDAFTAMGGSCVLTEVPEMFGAEGALFNRCVSRQVFDKAVAMITEFKRYFVSHGQTVYENPSPGNKEGGITTLEDKSLGCVQKGGQAPVRDVIGYAGRVKVPGLTLMYGPGNDMVSATALTAAGAQLILFTTGRGTPLGAPAPVLKISSNTALFNKKPGWIDLDAGTVTEGETVGHASERLMELVLKTADGEYLTCSEQNNSRGIAIFKNGVTL
ncbi:MAG: altronate dehydratase family protein [Clostridiales bacterium]|jgi:altronate hydrolase|nr:altronate dehydratase family protein [Clostridiales bacterium]